jgi:hypothetical protein
MSSKVEAPAHHAAGLKGVDFTWFFQLKLKQRNGASGSECH